MTRVVNFSAGPAALPEEVLRQAAAEMLDWQGSGQSVMEMSHRGKEFIGIAEAAEKDLRELLGVPADYKVLFLQGGATLQFEMIPLNLLAGNTGADYVHTGLKPFRFDRGDERIRGERDDVRASDRFLRIIDGFI